MGRYDVAIVGASIGGCTAAVLLARAGLRVALLEQHRNPDAYKVLCTHHVMACATPTIRRLSLDRAIEASGGIRNGLDFYTPWGWVVPPTSVPHGYSIRRERLDPMIRTLAAETPGVDLLLGHKVTGLIGDGDTVDGVRAAGPAGVEAAVRARLIIGADGARSAVARLTGAGERTAANRRFIYFAQFAGIDAAPRHRTRLWLHEPGISYAMPNDGGVTVLACMPTKDDLPRFRRDLEAAMLGTICALPDAPDLSSAERVSKIVGMVDYPLITRPALPAPGVALIGDAALTSDPSQGVGCGWAFQSAEWLSDAFAPALLGASSLESAAAEYVRQRRTLDHHQAVIEHEAQAGPPGILDRLLIRAATRDPALAAAFSALANRVVSVHEFASLGALVRAAWVNVRGNHEGFTFAARSSHGASRQ